MDIFVLGKVLCLHLGYKTNVNNQKHRTTLILLSTSASASLGTIAADLFTLLVSLF